MKNPVIDALDHILSGIHQAGCTMQCDENDLPPGKPGETVEERRKRIVTICCAVAHAECTALKDTLAMTGGKTIEILNEMLETFKKLESGELCDINTVLDEVTQENDEKEAKSSPKFDMDDFVRHLRTKRTDP